MNELKEIPRTNRKFMSVSDQSAYVTMCPPKLCKVTARDEKQNRKETGKCVATRHRQVYKAPNPPKWTTCARGAGTHGDVLDVDTEASFLDGHTMREGRRRGSSQFCLPKFASVRLSRAPEVGSTQKPMDLSPFL